MCECQNVEEITTIIIRIEGKKGKNLSCLLVSWSKQNTFSQLIEENYEQLVAHWMLYSTTAHETLANHVSLQKRRV